MPITIISSESYECRKELAEDLARKMGYDCLSREELVEEATRNGMPVGKLEVAVIKTPVMKERLIRLKQCYLAFVTATLCERMKEGNLIYHGRAGHLLLPGVSHVFRVRVLPEEENYVREVMRRLRLDRTKAIQYVQQVGRDVETWVRVIHGVDPGDLTQYDMVINLHHMSLPNASTALCGLMELPDFRPTPASMAAMENHRLASQARVQLALDERTSSADLRVTANDGVVTVTYMPRQAHLAEMIPAICENLEGCREIFCTMAATNILWIQEAYDPDSELFYQINQVAQRWGAAIELLRWVPTGVEMPGDLDDETGPERSVVQADEGDMAGRAPYTGGIEDDVEETPSMPDGGIGSAVERLVDVGRSGGSRTVRGTRETLLSEIRRDVNYSLVVVGNLSLSKPPAVQMRTARDLRGFLADRLRLPVIESGELGARFLFGKKQLIRLLVFLGFVVGIYALVFSHQEQVLNFLGGRFHERWPWLTPIGVAAVVPLIAYLYSTVTGLVLKMIRVE